MSTDSGTTVKMMDADELERHASVDAQAGFGALATGRGNLPLEEINLNAVVTGLAVRMDLVQMFRNPYDQPLEATYIFPLPDRAAVTALRMEADGRVVEGVLKERGQARADYDQAVAEGHRASIAEQERPGVFTMRVGNIMPGERVFMRLSLAGLLPYEDGAATFRFPLVVAPRYIPGAALAGAQVGDGVIADTDAVPDASRITPPVLLPGFPNPVRLTIGVHVNALADLIPVIHSSLHSVIDSGADPASGHWRHVHAQLGTRVDRDFVLRISYPGRESVTTALTTHRDGTGDYAAASTFALTLMPPTAAAAPAKPKAVVLLLDRSGSMGGWKLVAARRAAARIVDSLGPNDQFAVWTFDDSIQRPDTLPHPVHPASDRDRFRAVQYLATVTAGGGTELLAPLSQAVDLLSGNEIARRYSDRVVVLITDGQVGNEDQILRALGPRLGGIRIHTVGVDTAVNEGFLRSLATMSGGRCELVESEDRLDEAMRAIHHRIATPLVKNLRIESTDLPLDLGTVAPARLPDLFVGAPIVIMGRTVPGAAATGSVTLVGTTPDGFEWRQTITAEPSDNAALPAVWARTRIRDLEDRYASDPGPADMLEREIVNVSLRFNVLSRFTAFVAVDERVVTEAGALRRIVQPVEAPQGWAMFDQQAPVIGGRPELMRKARSRAPESAPRMGRRPVAATAVSGTPNAPLAPAPAPAVSSASAASPAIAREAEYADVALGAEPIMPQAMPRPVGPTPITPEPADESVLTQASVAQPAEAPDMRGRELRAQREHLLVSPPPPLPASVRTFAADARARLLQAAIQSFQARSAALVALGTEIEQNIHRFAADGLVESLLIALRQLASDLRTGAVKDRTGVHHLWIQAAELLEYLAGDEDTAQPPQPHRGGAFWRR